MHAKNLVSRGISVVCVLGLALALASCQGRNPKPTTYTVGGVVSGLTGAGLVLQNNGGNNLSISANGAFTFSTALNSGATYSVTVLTQPAGQICTIANGAGTVSANVTNVAVNCVANTFTVGGTVSGLTGTGLVLQNNGGNNLAIAADGPFKFSTAQNNGAAYSVTVLTQPSGQGCSVANGSGNIAGANVTNVAVACVAPPAPPTLSLGFGVKELRFTWPPVSGADFYRLRESADGGPTFIQVATNLTALSYNHTIPVHRRLNASYILDACNAGGCTPSFTQTLETNLLTQAIGYVKASNTESGDQFGFSVALSGDGNTLAIGAPNEDGVAPGAGAVYVFTHGALGWSQQAYVKASNPGKDDSFGHAVALNGDGTTLAVGAHFESSAATGIGGNQTHDCANSNNCATASGAVYVYIRSAGTWLQQAYVKASNTESADFFGFSIALNGDGNTLAVGAPNESGALTGVTAGSASEAITGNDAPNAGAVYVYTRAAGTWSQQAYVKASNTDASDMFGNSVALSGDGNTLAVGALAESSALTGVRAGSVNEATAGNAAPFAGAAYVYARNAGSWSQQAYVKASNSEMADLFGFSVVLSGDGNTLAVGAPGESSALAGVTSGIVTEAAAGNAASAAGAAYVYTRSASAWSQQAYVKASNTGTGDNFGSSVALSGDGNALVVGAPFEDRGGTGIDGTPPPELATDAGAGYFYTRSASTWSQKAYVKASNLNPSNTGAVDQFGTSVALSDDGNTLAVGAQLEDGGGTGITSTGIGNTANDLIRDSGAVYLY